MAFANVSKCLPGATTEHRFDLFGQKDNVFISKKIPFREILFNKNNEEELGMIFSFFVFGCHVVASFVAMWSPFMVEVVTNFCDKTLCFLENVVCHLYHLLWQCGHICGGNALDLVGYAWSSNDRADQRRRKILANSVR